MAGSVTINGQVYEFGSIQVLLPTGVVMVCQSITYKDKISGEVITDGRGLPIGYSHGEYSGDCDLEVSRNEYEKINKYAATAGGFYNTGPMSVTVTLAGLQKISQVDAFTVKWTERELGGKKGDKEINVPLKGMITSPIVSNGVPAFAGVL